MSSMGYASKNQGLLSKIATSDGHGEASPYFDGWKAYDNNPFHLSSNPEGVIQMGLAENQLCFDLIEEWLMKNPTASICNAEGIAMFKDIANFQDYHGLPAFRKAVANFMERARGGKAKFDPDRVVMSGGATGATETIAFCLANPDDAFLVPSPYYPAFDRDLRWRTGVQLLPVTCYSSNNFKITKEALEAAYAKAQEDNINVKGVLVNNPSNPLGTVLDRTTLQSIVSFVNEKNIHLVCDEIYAATVFNQPDFVSVAEIVEEDSSCNQELIHITYSLSKDMGLPGFRVGIVYSYNDAVVACARKMSSFGLVSSQTQYLISSMLSDNEFIDRFIIESSKRLATRHKAFTRGLAQVGIGCLESNAGLFFWMDLRHLLKESSVEAEMELWHVIIDEVKLNISPGSSFHCSEPGWFRVCFANMDNETMDVALNRIWSFVLKAKEAEVPVKPVKPVKSNRWQKNLRLSFKAPRFDEIGMNSDTMSPHSPLVTART